MFNSSDWKDSNQNIHLSHFRVPNHLDMRSGLLIYTSSKLKKGYLCWLPNYVHVFCFSNFHQHKHFSSLMNPSASKHWFQIWNWLTVLSSHTNWHFVQVWVYISPWTPINGLQFYFMIIMQSCINSKAHYKTSSILNWRLCSRSVPHSWCSLHKTCKRPWWYAWAWNH